MPTINIYSLPQVVNVTTSIGGTTMNFPLTRSDFRIFKGVSNPIDVFVKDIDRKPVVFSAGSGPVMHIIDPHADRVLMSRQLAQRAATKGLWRLTIEAAEATDWPEGFIEYVITVSDPQAVETMLFVDTGYGTRGTIEVKPGPFTVAKPPVLVQPDQLIVRQGKRYSGAIPGNAQVGGSDTFTGQVTVTGFTGTIAFQAFDVTIPTSDDTQWAPLFSTTLTNATGTVPVSFSGSHYWIRLVVAPSAGSFDGLSLTF